MRPGRPVHFTVLRVPFFLEPDYDTSESFEETNRESELEETEQRLEHLCFRSRKY